MYQENKSIVKNGVPYGCNISERIGDEAEALSVTDPSLDILLQISPSLELYHEKKSFLSYNELFIKKFFCKIKQKNSIFRLCIGLSTP